MFTKKQLMYFLTAIIFLLFSLDGCQDCKNGVVFIPAFRGTWKLIKIVSPSKTVLNLPYKEYLKITLRGDKNGNAITQERILRDSLSTGDTVLVATNEWTGYGADCKNTSVSVTLDSHLQRKYILSNGDQTLEATSYVSQIGDKSDTTKYFYQAQ